MFTELFCVLVAKKPKQKKKQTSRSSPRFKRRKITENDSNSEDSDSDADLDDRVSDRASHSDDSDSDHVESLSADSDSARDDIDSDHSGSSGNEGTEYEIEKVVGKKFSEDGACFYLIKWNGYPWVKNTWEPESSVNHCKELLKQYLSKESISRS